MKINRMLYRNRFGFMLLVAVFYAAAVVFFVQLAQLDSSQTLTLTQDGNDMFFLTNFQILNQTSDPELSLSYKSIKENLPISDEKVNQSTLHVRSLLLNNSTERQALNKSPNNSTERQALNKFLEYIDWNDHALMAREVQRKGWGESGLPFNKILSVEEQELANQLFEQYKFNAFASDHISLERHIGDLRPTPCKTKKFLKDLPKNAVSVVIIFHNEKNSTVLRTLHSVVNRSPATLLREIVLVDDFSSNQELKEPLEDYIRLHLPKVRLIRNNHRQGLIKSRMTGANATNGDILLFLDSHTEVNHNYLPPLLDPLVLDYRKIVCPVVEVIHTETLEVRNLDSIERGAFSWDMIFRRLPFFQEDETAPFDDPVMIGSAFAISRKWWDELGQYDPELNIWGGEQFELSFKSWQCGGSVVCAPCSSVAHIFRKLPYLHEILKDNVLNRNLLRVAAVWMDEYAEYVFQRRPELRAIDSGDLTKQFAIKKRLNCKSFKWYLTEVVPDLIKYYPLIGPPRKAWGSLRSTYNSSLCILPKKNGLYLCDCNESNDIFYIYDWRQQIRYFNQCFTNRDYRYIFMKMCMLQDVYLTQSFVLDDDSKKIIHLSTHLCVDVDILTMEVYMAKCEISKTTQSWTFEFVDSTLVKEAWTKYRVQLGM